MSKVFSLLYLDAPLSVTAEIGLVGPKLFATRAAAENELAVNYVSHRIFDCFLELFIEDAEGLGIQVPKDGSVTREGFIEFFAALTFEQQQSVNDWYFEQADDVDSDAFYKIEELSIPVS